MLTQDAGKGDPRDLQQQRGTLGVDGRRAALAALQRELADPLELAPQRHERRRSLAQILAHPDRAAQHQVDVLAWGAFLEEHLTAPQLTHVGCADDVADDSDRNPAQGRRAAGPSNHVLRLHVSIPRSRIIRERFERCTPRRAAARVTLPPLASSASQMVRTLKVRTAAP
jgi:hypothetical protein